MLKIRQSYHGNGGREGYRFEVYNSEDDYLGEIKKFPIHWGYQELFHINGKIYEVVESYDSDLPHEEIDEVVYHVLKEYVVVPDYDLGDIVNLTEYFFDLIANTINSVDNNYVKLIEFNDEMDEIYVLTKDGGLTITVKEEMPKKVFDKFTRILEDGAI